MRKFMPSTKISNEELLALVKLVDVDSSGAVEFDEYLRLIVHLVPADADAPLLAQSLAQLSFRASSLIPPRLPGLLPAAQATRMGGNDAELTNAQQAMVWITEREHRERQIAKGRARTDRITDSVRGRRKVLVQISSKMHRATSKLRSMHDLTLGGQRTHETRLLSRYGAAAAPRKARGGGPRSKSVPVDSMHQGDGGGVPIGKSAAVLTEWEQHFEHMPKLQARPTDVRRARFVGRGKRPRRPSYSCDVRGVDDRWRDNDTVAVITTRGVTMMRAPSSARRARRSSRASRSRRRSTWRSASALPLSAQRRCARRARRRWRRQGVARR